MPDSYGPLFAASAVLADGRVIIVGGEYNIPSNTPVNRTRAALYDPIANQWIPIPEPNFFRTGQVIDSASVVLDDGTFLIFDPISSNLLFFLLVSLIMDVSSFAMR